MFTNLSFSIPSAKIHAISFLLIVGLQKPLACYTQFDSALLMGQHRRSRVCLQCRRQRRQTVTNSAAARSHFINNSLLFFHPRCRLFQTNEMHVRSRTERSDFLFPIFIFHLPNLLNRIDHGVPMRIKRNTF